MRHPMIRAAMTARGKKRHLVSLAVPGIYFSLCGWLIDMERTKRVSGRVTGILRKPDCRSCAAYLWRGPR